MIKRNSKPGDVVMAISGLVGYYADRPVLLIPNGSPKEVIGYGRKNGARFLLVDTKSVFTRRPELDELFNPLKGKPINPAYGIEVVSRNYVPYTGAYIIYRLQ